MKEMILKWKKKMISYSELLPFARGNGANLIYDMLWFTVEDENLVRVKNPKNNRQGVSAEVYGTHNQKKVIL